MRKIIFIVTVLLSSKAFAQKTELFLFQSLESVSIQKMDKSDEFLTNRDTLYEDDSFIVHKITFVEKKNVSKKDYVTIPLETFEFIYYFIDVNDGKEYHKYFFAKKTVDPRLTGAFLIMPYRSESMNLSKDFIQFQDLLFELSEQDYLKAH